MIFAMVAALFTRVDAMQHEMFVVIGYLRSYLSALLSFGGGATQQLSPSVAGQTFALAALLLCSTAGLCAIALRQSRSGGTRT